MRVLFNHPKISKKNLNKIIEISNRKKNLSFSVNSLFSEKCSKYLIKYFSSYDVLMTKSCTAALEICSKLIIHNKAKEKNEIIFPNYTYFTSVSSFLKKGIRPVLVDTDPFNLNIDVKILKKKITKKTLAIVVIHYAGIPCDIEKIKKICQKNNIILIEDCANAIFAKKNNKPLGSFGDLSTLSFHETKNIHCGDGGALIINNKKFLKRSRIILNKGTNRHLFNKGNISKYTWVDYGSAYGISEINAVILYEQLKNGLDITNKRRDIFYYYFDKLKKLESKKKNNFTKNIK